MGLASHLVELSGCKEHHREAREAISEARQAVVEERDHFIEVSHLAKNELGEFHQLAVDALRGLVKDCDRNLKGTVCQITDSHCTCT